MIDRETLAASFVSAQMIAAPSWARANCNPGTHEQFLEDAFKLADAFLAYAAKQREPKACPCLPEWKTPTGCAHCGAPKVKPEPPKAFEPEPEFDRNDIGGDYMVKCNHAHTNSTFTTGLPPKEISRVCTLCGASVLPEPQKPERVARELWVSFQSNGYPADVYTHDCGYGELVKFREVLPEDGK